MNNLGSALFILLVTGLLATAFLLRFAINYPFYQECVASGLTELYCFLI